jgi:putative isomerase
MSALSPYLELLRNRVNLVDVPFTERGSRLLVYGSGQRFSVRLAERWFKQDLQLASYRSRPPILDELLLSDAQGNPLDLNLTTYPHQVLCSTPAGQFRIAFADQETLLITLPPGKCGVSFLARVDQAQMDRRGGVLRLTGEIRRNIAYTTNTRLVENRLEYFEPGIYRVRLVLEEAPDAGCAPLLQVNITPRLGFNRYISDPDAAIEAAAARWHEWFSSVPAIEGDLARQYYFAWWVMRAGLISPRYFITREAMTPSKMHYVGVWQWDAYFHALAYRYVDIRLAHDQLRIQLDHQTPAGMIPDAIHDEGTVTHLPIPVDADVTKPPLIAWTAWKLHQYHPDLEFLREIYEPMTRLNQWWFERNDIDHNGLCEYQHPFSSGLDDSPLWDAGMPVESPDLNTYLYLQQEALARIALAIGEKGDAQMWTARAETLLQKMLEHSWDAQAGLFWARHAGAVVPVRTPFNLFPLITGRLPAEITRRLVAQLTDSGKFWSRYPVPSVALDDPHYDPQTMWRGPTWINVNYLLIEGLQRSGYLDLARELRRRTLELMSQQEDIYEYYHPESGINPPKAAPIFGWSAAIFIELAIQVI